MKVIRFVTLVSISLFVSACGGGGSDSSPTPTPPPAAPTYTVTATAGPGGAISPSSRSVTSGQTTTFTVSANSGYEISSATGCGGALSGTTFTTGAITSACSVSALFRQIPSSGMAVSGKVIDGYISGATVFLDLNGNEQLDSNEPSAITDAEGDYNLDGDVYIHSSRQVIFLGDFIDKGPNQKEVLKIVMPMVKHGSALAVMGNHEFNAWPSTRHTRINQANG